MLLAGPLGRFPTSEIEMPQFIERVVGDMPIDAGRAMQRIVVRCDDAAVAREPEIGFNGVGPLFPGQFHRGTRILRSIPRRTAMGDEFQGTA